MSHYECRHGMKVQVVDGCLVITTDVEACEFIVSELPAGDEITKMLARGAVALALDAYPNSAFVARQS